MSCDSSSCPGDVRPEARGNICEDCDDGDGVLSAWTVRNRLSFRRKIHRLPSDPVGEGREARLCAIVANGKPLGEHRLRWRSGEVGDGNFEDRFGELMGLGHVLVGAALDARVASIETTEKPDFRLRLVDGSIAHAEVGRVLVESAAELSNCVTSLRRTVRQREGGDSVLQRSLLGSATTLTIAKAPAPRQIGVACEETLALLNWIAGDGDYGQRAIDPVRFPVLSAVGETCEVLRHGYRVYSFDIDPLPPPCNPDAMRSAFGRMRAKKAAKRKGYPANEPVWLLMPLADEFEAPSKVLEALQKDVLATDARPYDLLAVGTIDGAIVL